MTRRSSWIWPPPMGVRIMTPPGMEEMANQSQGCSRTWARTRRKSARSRSKEAMKALADRREAARLVNPEELKLEGHRLVEKNGIVFLDEIDKICKRGESSGRRRFP